MAQKNGAIKFIPNPPQKRRLLYKMENSQSRDYSSSSEADNNQSIELQINSLEDSEELSVPLEVNEESIRRSLLEVPKACDDVINNILHNDDKTDPLLTSIHKFHKKFYVASRLLKNICFSYEKKVDAEFKTTVHELLFNEKFLQISKKITRQKHLEVQKEKYFAKAAEEFISRQLQEANTILELPPESFQSEFYPSQIQHSVLREEHTPEFINLQNDTRPLPMEELSVHAPQTELSIGLIPTIPEKEITKAMSPIENSLRLTDIPIEPVLTQEHRRTDVENDVSKDSDEFKLSSLESLEPAPKKKTGLIIDSNTIIPKYAAKALMLNKSIIIQRVQVFDGPPTVLQAFSLEHMMKTPAYKSSRFSNTRSDKLNKLFKKQVLLEKKPHETVNIARKRTVEERRQEELQLKEDIVIEELIDSRPAMQAKPGRREILSDVVIPEKTFPEEPAVADVALIPSKPDQLLLPQAAQPSDTSTPEFQTRPQWFFSTKQIPPSRKWKEFRYVIEQLEEQWALLEALEADKTIWVSEFFAKENGVGMSNYLTLVRILDKLSLQRKIVMGMKNGNLFVQPFELPYVSNIQYLLKEKEPKF